MRALAALRVAAEISIVQRGQVPCSLSFTEPQKGQTYFPRRDSLIPSVPPADNAVANGEIGSEVCVTASLALLSVRSRKTERAIPHRMAIGTLPESLTAGRPSPFMVRRSDII